MNAQKASWLRREEVYTKRSRKGEEGQGLSTSRPTGWDTTKAEPREKGICHHRSLNGVPPARDCTLPGIGIGDSTHGEKNRKPLRKTSGKEPGEARWQQFTTASMTALKRKPLSGIPRSKESERKCRHRPANHRRLRRKPGGQPHCPGSRTAGQKLPAPTGKTARNPQIRSRNSKARNPCSP